MEQTSLNPAAKLVTAIALVIGVLMQSGGFFLHLLKGQPGKPSWGTRMTMFGAVILAAAVFILVYGLFITYF